MNDRTKAWTIARRLRSTGPDLVGPLNQDNHLCAFSTELFSHGRFEFIAFLGKLVAEDNSHGQPLASEVGCRAEMTHHLCPNHFAICAALGSLSSVALSSAQMTVSLSDPSYFRQFVVLTLGSSIV